MTLEHGEMSASELIDRFGRRVVEGKWYGLDKAVRLLNYIVAEHRAWQVFETPGYQAEHRARLDRFMANIGGSVFETDDGRSLPIFHVEGKSNEIKAETKIVDGRVLSDIWVSYGYGGGSSEEETFNDVLALTFAKRLYGLFNEAEEAYQRYVDDGNKADDEEDDE